MAEHFLNASEVRASLEEVRCEGVTQEMRMNAPRVEPRFLGQPLQDQKRAGAAIGWSADFGSESVSSRCGCTWRRKSTRVGRWSSSLIS